MHEVLFNRLGGLSLPRKSVVRLTDRPDMTLDVYRGRKTTIQQQQQVYTNMHRSSPMHVIAALEQLEREIDAYLLHALKYERHTMVSFTTL